MTRHSEQIITLTETPSSVLQSSMIQFSESSNPFTLPPWSLPTIPPYPEVNYSCIHNKYHAIPIELYE